VAGYLSHVPGGRPPVPASLAAARGTATQQRQGTFPITLAVWQRKHSVVG
jgi:hypothetical protein